MENIKKKNDRLILTDGSKVIADEDFGKNESGILYVKSATESWGCYVIPKRDVVFGS